MSDKASTPWTDWQLEQFALGELPPAQQQRLAAALPLDGALAARLAALRRSDADILRRYAPAEQAVQIARRAPAGAQRPHRPAPAWWLAGSAVAAGLALLVVAVLPTAVDDSALGPGCFRQGDEVICLKGSPSLTVFRRAGDAQVALGEGELVRQGDVLQLSYNAAGRRYGAIVSVDGRGAVTTHFPDAPWAAKLEGKPTALGHAYELDDAPGFERFFFVTAPEPFAVARVVEAIEQLRRGAGGAEAVQTATLTLPVGLEQVSVTVRKGGGL